jgi:hypothetical protein
MTGAPDSARSSVKISSIPAMPLKMRRVLQGGAEIGSGYQLPAACPCFAADPLFVRAGRDLDHIGQAVIVMTRAGEILEALRFAANASAQSPQMFPADDTERFRPHRAGVLLQQT